MARVQCFCCCYSIATVIPISFSVAVALIFSKCVYIARCVSYRQCISVRVFIPNALSKPDFIFNSGFVFQHHYDTICVFLLYTFRFSITICFAFTVRLSDRYHICKSVSKLKRVWNCIISVCLSSKLHVIISLFITLDILKPERVAISQLIG